jgi:hypothetical protein
VADDARVVLVADHRLVAGVDAEALEEPLVAGDVDGDLVRVEIEHGDPRLGARGLEGRLRPFADQLAGPEVVGRERGVGRVGRLDWGVEGDHEQTGLAGPVESGNDRFGVVRRDQDAGGPGGDEIVDRVDLRLVVAVLLAGEGLEFDAQLLGRGLGPLAHLDEERVGVGLRDEADEHVIARSATRGRLVVVPAAGRQAQRHRQAGPDDPHPCRAPPHPSHHQHRSTSPFAAAPLRHG